MYIFQYVHRRKRQAQNDDLYDHRAYKEYVQERLATITTLSPELVRRKLEMWPSHPPMNTTSSQPVTHGTTTLTPLKLNYSQTTPASYSAVVSSSSSNVTQSPSTGDTSESSIVSQETGKSKSIIEVTKSSKRCSKVWLSFFVDLI